jgi:copper chaperone CopZ
MEPTTETIDSTGIPLKRILLEISSQIFQVNVFLQLLHSVPFVRSTHVLSVGSSSPTSTSGIILMAVCGEATMDLIHISKLLESLPQVTYKCLSEKIYRWNKQEVVLHVDGMMCVGNCGNTVMRAIQSNVPHVDTANLDFETRRVIVRGQMQVKDLLVAIQEVGFEPSIKAITPIPKRFLFRVKKLYEMSFIGNKLKHLLQKIEGVEQVIVMPDKAEVLVIGLLTDSTLLLGTTARNGLFMVEIPETSPQISPIALTPTSLQQQQQQHATNTTTTTTTSVNGTTTDPVEENHVCDLKVCPQNGCQQYMATVAHTAALAVGWVVPGCAMSWGGECTCGENCKCKGCPKHNPPSILPLPSSSSSSSSSV